ncbi:MAG: ArsB/NhaD family transporter [Ktedonobacterales bacterium]
MSLATFHAVAAAVVLIAVLLFVVLRPRGLHVAWPAGVGALAAIAIGLLSIPALLTIFGTTWDAAATLISLFLLSEALASNGFFVWAALHLARSARGSGWRLYLLVLLLTTGVTALLANDGAVLMLTPIFATLLLTIYPDERSRLPYLFAAGFFADAMSALFVPSNLTNIILADDNHLSFAHVAAWMAIPMICAFAAGTLAFGLRFRKRLSKPYDTRVVGVPAEAIRDHTVFVAGWVVLCSLVAAYLVIGELHLPFSLAAGAAALVMLALTHIRRLRSASEVLRAAPWNILVYALGMFVVITAAFDANILGFLTQPLRTHVTPSAAPLGALFSGGLLALLAAAVNNLPAALLGVLTLRAVAQPAHVAIYAIILGVDIGPKLTPFGSLATLLWLGILDKNGIHISWGHYLRENWWVAVVVLGVAFAGLLLSNLLLR